MGRGTTQVKESEARQEILAAVMSAGYPLLTAMLNIIRDEYELWDVVPDSWLEETGGE